MAYLRNLRVLLVANSSELMHEDSFKSDLYPEIFKIFYKLFGNSKICFCNEVQIFDYKQLSDLKKISRKSNFKNKIINLILHFFEFLFGKNFYTEKIRYRQLLNKIKKFNSEFDLVISISSTSNSGVLGCLISKKLGIPFIILEHMTLYQRKLIRFWHKRFLRKVQNLAKIIAPVSEPLDASLKKFNPNINTCVIYNPISDFMFENTTSDLSSHLKDFAGGSFCFGAWTTWRKIKRLDLLLGAFSEFKLKSRKSCKLIVGGKFADKKLVYKMKKDPDILFLGALSRKDINVLSAFSRSNDCNTFVLICTRCRTLRVRSNRYDFLYNTNISIYTRFFLL